MVLDDVESAFFFLPLFVASLVVPEPLVADDWLVVALWFRFEVELTSVDCWFAETSLVTLWLPLPTFTPGLMFALALRSVLAMPTFASTPTFGLTFRVEPLVPAVEPVPDVEPVPAVAPLVALPVAPDVEPVVEPLVVPVKEPLVVPVVELVVPLVEPMVDPVVAPLVEPLRLPEVEPLVEPSVEPVVPVALWFAGAFVVPAWLSGMQSMCTGLAECSFALPVSLSASLPACGWPRLLHSGLSTEVVVAVAPAVVGFCDVAEALPCAMEEPERLLCIIELPFAALSFLPLFVAS